MVCVVFYIKKHAVSAMQSVPGSVTLSRQLRKCGNGQGYRAHTVLALPWPSKCHYYTTFVMHAGQHTLPIESCIIQIQQYFRDFVTFAISSSCLTLYRVTPGATRKTDQSDDLTGEPLQQLKSQRSSNILLLGIL